MILVTADRARLRKVSHVRDPRIPPAWRHVALKIPQIINVGLKEFCGSWGCRHALRTVTKGSTNRRTGKWAHRWVLGVLFLSSAVGIYIYICVYRPLASSRNSYLALFCEIDISYTFPSAWDGSGMSDIRKVAPLRRNGRRLCMLHCFTIFRYLEGKPIVGL